MDAEYGLSKEQVLESIGSSELGLSAEEVAKRQEKYGPNKLKEAEKATWLQKFLAQLKDPMLIILMIAAGVYNIIFIRNIYFRNLHTKFVFLY